MRKLHVGIAGAGLAGRTLAWRLLRAGCRVSLFDARQRSDINTASMTAAAMLSPLWIAVVVGVTLRDPERQGPHERASGTRTVLRPGSAEPVPAAGDEG